MLVRVGIYLAFALFGVGVYYSIEHLPESLPPRSQAGAHGTGVVIASGGIAAGKQAADSGLSVEAIAAIVLSALAIASVVWLLMRRASGLPVARIKDRPGP